MTFRSSPDESLIGRATFFVHHGLIMIEDPESAFHHDDWDPALEDVSAGPDSVYLSVQPAVDGPVEIGIFRSEAGLVDGVAYFDGDLVTSSGMFVIHDANDVMRFTVRAPRGRVRVEVHVDQPGLASRMSVAFVFE